MCGRAPGRVVEHLGGCRRRHRAVGELGEHLPGGVAHRAHRAHVLVGERLEQRYVRVPDDGSRQRYDYSAPRFDYNGQLAYDAAGLLIESPGLAERAAWVICCQSGSESSW